MYKSFFLDFEVDIFNKNISDISSTDRLALNANIEAIAVLLMIVATLIWLAIYNSIRPTSYYTH